MPERQRILVILNESNNFHLNRLFFIKSVYRFSNKLLDCQRADFAIIPKQGVTSFG